MTLRARRRARRGDADRAGAIRQALVPLPGPAEVLGQRDRGRYRRIFGSSTEAVLRSSSWFLLMVPTAPARSPWVAKEVASGWKLRPSDHCRWYLRGEFARTMASTATS